MYSDEYFLLCAPMMITENNLAKGRASQIPSTSSLMFGMVAPLGYRKPGCVRSHLANLLLKVP